MISQPAKPDFDPATAIAAAGWIVSQPRLIERFFSLTGLTVADLRARLDTEELHEAVRQFLAQNEADLVACAAALGVAPKTLLPRKELS